MDNSKKKTTSTAQPKASNLKTITFVKVVAIFYLSIFLGMYGGCNYFQRTNPPNEPVWHSLGQPPDEIIELLMVDAYTVYVLTNSNSVYACYWESARSNQCWVEAKQLPEITQDAYADETCDDHVQEFFEPPTPDELVDGITCTDYFSWAGRPKYSSFQYALLADGTVLQRLYDKNYRPFRIFVDLIIYVLVGGIIGLIIGIGVARNVVIKSRT